jgi:hypothetical protein
VDDGGANRTNGQMCEAEDGTQSITKNEKTLTCRR